MPSPTGELQECRWFRGRVRACTHRMGAIRLARRGENGACEHAPYGSLKEWGGRGGWPDLRVSYEEREGLGWDAGVTHSNPDGGFQPTYRSLNASGMRLEFSRALWPTSGVIPGTLSRFADFIDERFEHSGEHDSI